MEVWMIVLVWACVGVVSQYFAGYHTIGRYVVAAILGPIHIAIMALGRGPI